MTVVLNAVQTMKIAREWRPDDPEFHAAVNSMVHEYEGAPGFGVTVLVCSHCGALSASFHHVPMKYPAECGICGRFACYEWVDDV